MLLCASKSVVASSNPTMTLHFWYITSKDLKSQITLQFQVTYSVRHQKPHLIIRCEPSKLKYIISASTMLIPSAKENWASMEMKSDLGSSFVYLWSFTSSGSLECSFDISFNIASSFFTFSLAFDVSVDEAITIDYLAEFSLLLTDSSIGTLRTFFRLNITAARI